MYFAYINGSCCYGCEANTFSALNNLTGLFARCREVPRIPTLSHFNNQERHPQAELLSSDIYLLFIESQGVINTKNHSPGAEGEREACKQAKTSACAPSFHGSAETF